ncbi:MAG: TlyA family RNA methyltransferase [Candidatus Rifleibacteriota bacterium]
MKKIRVDELVVRQELAENVDKARRMIMAGEIRTGDRLWDKAGEKIPVDTKLEVKSKTCKWVSKGGLKLEEALKTFSFNPEKMRCLDIGASTGGFTHVLLENNAAEIVALDVGYGQLDARIKSDARIVVKDRTNFRTIEKDELGESFDLVVADVSFISLRMILPKAAEVLRDTGSVIALIKPQFEASRDMVPAGGVIKDSQTHIRVIGDLVDDISQESCLSLVELAPVPLVSRKKNIEFVSLWRKNQINLSPREIESIVLKAHRR